MRILLADDQIKVLSALKLLLGQEPEMNVVGEAVEAEQMMDCVRETNPDLVLIDWELPGLSSNGRFSALRSSFPDLKVIALSGRPEARRRAMDTGVDAFVSKGNPPDRLLEVLRKIAGEIRTAKNVVSSKN